MDRGPRGSPGRWQPQDKISRSASVPVENPIVLHGWKGQRLAVYGFQRFEPEDDCLRNQVRKILDR